MENNEILFRCSNVSLSYENITVLRNLSFEMPRGKILLISGENGSGKSSLVKALLGLIRPTEGNIEFLSLSQKDIGYLPQQNKMNRKVPSTVSEIVYSGFAGRLRFGFLLPSGAKEKAEKAMDITGIRKLGKRPFSELSGGQMQRVLLARALCAGEKLLVLDEPTNGLDPDATSDMYSVLSTLREEGGLTVVMVSHDIEASLSLADYVLHLCCDGSFFCSADEYYDRVSRAHEHTNGVCSHTHEICHHHCDICEEGHHDDK